MGRGEPDIPSLGRDAPHGCRVPRMTSRLSAVLQALLLGRRRDGREPALADE